MLGKLVKKETYHFYSYSESKLVVEGKEVTVRLNIGLYISR